MENVPQNIPVDESNSQTHNIRGVKHFDTGKHEMVEH
jgi:hypothetical protein